MTIPFPARREPRPRHRQKKKPGAPRRRRAGLVVIVHRPENQSGRRRNDRNPAPHHRRHHIKTSDHRPVFWLTGKNLLAAPSPPGGCPLAGQSEWRNAAFVPDYSGGSAVDLHHLPRVRTIRTPTIATIHFSIQGSGECTDASACVKENLAMQKLRRCCQPDRPGRLRSFCSCPQQRPIASRPILRGS